MTVEEINFEIKKNFKIKVEVERFTLYFEMSLFPLLS